MDETGETQPNPPTRLKRIRRDPMDPGKKNCFAFFVERHYKILRKTAPYESHKMRMTKIAQMWKKLTRRQKNEFRLMANQHNKIMLIERANRRIEQMMANGEL